MRCLPETISQLSEDFLESLGLALWIEIITLSPHCIYYFGPFASKKDARIAIPGYLKNLEQKKAQVSTINVKRGKPIQLTILGTDLEEYNKSQSAQSHYFIKAVYS
ncbi:DUF1816 domain-containing protein [Kamptonema animale CS-326]|jgi:hypothetical protein|uniref:DUF1816 domain-containing protein n=1 Tax=Kamptonema animale TaxID=92934 RepID=UPI00232BDF13|nr:DUF1816 domain-containing protein [Kamptonema animale]MDB9510989.1 DUF1816 domain-containing protein [Kamptonema animale CS-326]